MKARVWKFVTNIFFFNAVIFVLKYLDAYLNVASVAQREKK